MVIDEKETPEAGETETEPEVAEEVAEPEATEEAAEPEESEEAAKDEGAVEVAEPQTAPDAGYTRGQLQQMTIKKLREIALRYQEIAGVHGMNKDELVESIFTLKGREVGEGEMGLAVDKTAIKQEIRDLKDLRTSALETGDGAELKRVRKRIKRLKRTLRKAS